MYGYINGIDWLNEEAMKYWSFTASTSVEKRKEVVNEAIFGGEYLGALKVDGYYQRILKDEDGNCFMIARSRNVNGEVVNKIDWVPHLKEWINTLPDGTCLLCECYLPGHEGSKNITSILGCLKEKAIQRQASMPLNFYVFDVMALNHTNLNKTKFKERVALLSKLSNDYVNQYVQYAVYYEGIELWNNLQEYLASGREGIVIMRKDAIVYNKRTPARVSIKIKKELQETLDVVVMGANAPTRLYSGTDILNWKLWENIVTGEKLKGSLYKDYSDGASIEPVTKTYWNNWAGSLIIGMNRDGHIEQIGSISGLTEEVLSNWKDYVGKVAEITGMQIFENGGGVRHPKFIRWRDDLSPQDTDWNRWFGSNK